MTVERFIKGKTYESSSSRITIEWEGKVGGDWQYVGTTDGMAYCLTFSAWKEVEPDKIRYFVLYRDGGQGGYVHQTEEEARLYLGDGWKALMEVNITRGTCRVVATNEREES